MIALWKICNDYKLMKKRFHRLGKLILGISIVILFNSTIAFSQINFASPFPDRIILNLSENASTSLAVINSTMSGLQDPAMSRC